MDVHEIFTLTLPRKVTLALHENDDSAFHDLSLPPINEVDSSISWHGHVAIPILTKNILSLCSNLARRHSAFMQLRSKHHKLKKYFSSFWQNYILQT